MPENDSIVRPSFLLKSTLEKVNRGENINKVAARKSRKQHGLVSLKDVKTFKLSDVRIAEEGYFKGNKFFKIEPSGGGRTDVLGDPVPYTFGSDNVISGLLLLCFVIAMGGISVARLFLSMQLRTFFGATGSLRRQADNVSVRTAQPFFLFQTALLLGIGFFILTHKMYGGLYDEAAPIVRIGVFAAEFLAYFVVKRLLYSGVNWVFFDKTASERWRRASSFLNSAEGMLLFPLVLLLVYFKLEFQAALIYAGIVLVLVKLFQLYKAYTIFFSRMSGSFQIFLYFCSLEIIPLMVLGGVLNITGNYLKINF